MKIELARTRSNTGEKPKLRRRFEVVSKKDIFQLPLQFMSVHFARSITGHRAALSFLGSFRVLLQNNRARIFRAIIILIAISGILSVFIQFRLIAILAAGIPPFVQISHDLPLPFFLYETTRTAGTTPTNINGICLSISKVTC